MISIGLAVEQFHRFFLFAYFLFSCSLFWAIGWWVNSEPLERKKPKPTKQQKKRKEPIPHASYNAWKWGVPFLMTLAFLGSVKLTSGIELARELSLLGGRLVPANDPNPSSFCSPEGNEIALYLGTNAVRAEDFPLTLIKISDTPVAILDRNEDGTLALSLDVRSADNRLIARLDKGTFTINQNNYFSMKRKDRSSLVVVDEYGAEVLNARYANPHVFLLSAQLFSSGKHIDLQGMPISGNCLTIPKGGKIGSVLGF
jgi:hypothetical protein